MANFMIKNKLTPGVIFVFSIKKIDEYSMFLYSTNDYTEGAEKNKIIKFFDKCMSVLTVIFSLFLFTTNYYNHINQY